MKRALVACAAVVLLATGCSQGARQQLARELSRAAAPPSGELLTGRLELALHPVRSTGPTIAGGGTLASAGVAIDPERGRAALLGPSDRVIALFDDQAMYARRLARSAADKRTWARLDLERLPLQQELPKLRALIDATTPGEIVVVGPLFLLRLLDGVLTGSVRVRAVDPDGNRRVTANVSISKADRKHHIRDDAEKRQRATLRTLAVKDDVHAVDVVLRKDGSLASARFTLSERPDKLTRLDLVLTLTLDPPKPVTDVSVDLQSPSRDTTIRMPALGDIEGAVRDQIVPKGVQQLPPVPGVDVVASQP